MSEPQRAPTRHTARVLFDGKTVAHVQEPKRDVARHSGSETQLMMLEALAMRESRTPLLVPLLAVHPPLV